MKRNNYVYTENYLIATNAIRDILACSFENLRSDKWIMEASKGRYFIPILLLSTLHMHTTHLHRSGKTIQTSHPIFITYPKFFTIDSERIEKVVYLIPSIEICHPVNKIKDYQNLFDVSEKIIIKRSTVSVLLSYKIDSLSESQI